MRFDTIGSLIDGNRIGCLYIRGPSERGDDLITVTELGPFHSIEDYIKAVDDTTAEPKSPLSSFFELLRSVISSIDSEKPAVYYLGFNNFNSENMLCDEDGNLTSICDWRGAHTLPRGLGCGRYPDFIIRDFNPMYGALGYGELTAEWEDSPKQLANFRLKYKDLLET